MTLGEFIKNYRIEHDISMDKFSEMSGISKSYISLLEKNRHPKTGKPIAPSIKCIHQVADCVHIDFNILFSMLDGSVSVSDESLSIAPTKVQEPQSSSVSVSDFVLAERHADVDYCIHTEQGDLLIEKEDIELLRAYRESHMQEAIKKLLGL